MGRPKIFNVVGARPQIIKSAAMSRLFRGEYARDMEEIIVHTGQHYDREMSQVFFEELEIPLPDHHLHTGSGSHGRQTGEMMRELEELMLREKPDLVVVYGDTNSTLAAALAASKLRIPLAHIEAGLRSYNKSMPEEINRIVADHVSTLLFAPTLQGTENLALEGIVHSEAEDWDMDHPAVVHSGDVMYDNALYYAGMADEKTRVLERLSIEEGNYVLATLHRDSNTDDPLRLRAVLETLAGIAEKDKIKMVLPLHPRTRKMIGAFDLGEALNQGSFFQLIAPVSYLEMIALEKNARMIMTDSGGVQKEAHFFRKPCLVFRKETEWVELVENGTAILVDANPVGILEAWEHFRNTKNLEYPAFYGKGDAAGQIAAAILEFLGKRAGSTRNITHE